MVFWYRGKRQGQEQSPSQIEKGRQGVRTWRPFCFHTMGRGAEPQGLFSFHPAALYTSAAGRPKHPLPWAAHAEGRPRASLVNLPPPPLFGSFLKNKSLRGK